MKNKVRIIIAVTLITAGLALIGAVAYMNVIRQQQPVFSRNAMLTSLWAQYKNSYLEADSGRTIDKERDNLTTSEGQSYTMLRAVWQDDRETFDSSLKFTNDILRRDDNLFSWQFGKLPDGSYGILTEQGGENTASDADGDIALALIFASQRWQEKAYLDQAKQIIDAIWEEEVITVDGKPLLVANNLEQNNTESVIVNPSYFSPASYRIFAKIDTQHDWNTLADSSYTWLEKIRTAPELGTSVGLPPDWVSVRLSDGAVIPPTSSNLTTNFGYDAMRTPLRLALDYQWNNSEQAKDALDKMSFFTEQWEKNGKLNTVYTRSGEVTGNYEAPALYGGVLGYFMVSDQKNYETLYDQKLKALYNSDTMQWRDTLSYYDDNLAWFGLALHEKTLVDLSKN